jgi:cytoskeleton protein RodZ
MDDSRTGELLERARRERGLSLRDVENATKIRTRYLEGLEREDYSMLPDQVYVQGFLKTYANYLGLDGEGLAEDFKERRAPRRERGLDYERPRSSEFDRPVISPGGLAGAERRRISGTAVLTVVLALILIALVGGALYYVGSRSAGTPGTGDSASVRPVPSEREPEPAREPEPRPAEEEAPATPEGPEQEASVEPAGPVEPATERLEEHVDEAADGDVDVVVRVGDRASWLNVEADGAVVYYETAQAGFVLNFEGREYVSVTAGDAGAVDVQVDGRDVGPLGYYGQVASQTFTPAQPPA